MRRILFITAILAAFPALAQEAPSLPDANLTPGAVFASVTAEEVCTPGYAGLVRHVTAAVKREVFARYGVEGNHRGFCSGVDGCEIDHLISLELGGNNDATNLWPQSYDGTWNAHMKDRLENRLHKLVCDGDLPLKEAQRAIAKDWIAAYRQYINVEAVAER